MLSRWYLTIIEHNPFAEQLREKISMLETFQTPRTSKEFFDAIYGTFAQINISLTRPWFIEHNYILSAKDNDSEMWELSLEPTGIYTAQYQKTFPVESSEKQKNVLVTTDFAYRIPSLREDITIGRTQRKERIPVLLTINDKPYPLIKDLDQL